jgi:hypothetical protein
MKISPKLHWEFVGLGHVIYESSTLDVKHIINTILSSSVFRITSFIRFTRTVKTNITPTMSITTISTMPHAPVAPCLSA